LYKITSVENLAVKFYHFHRQCIQAAAATSMAANINSWHCFTHILCDWHRIYPCWHRSAVFLWWGKLALFLCAFVIKGDDLVIQKLQWLL